MRSTWNKLDTTRSKAGSRVMVEKIPQMTNMTELEITRLCAEAMGLDYHIAHVEGDDDEVWVRMPPAKPPTIYSYRYAPLHEDAQAMALVKKLRLVIYFVDWPSATSCWTVDSQSKSHAEGHDLNRAICECVANMQQAKK